jgi:hypothetical protein
MRSFIFLIAVLLLFGLTTEAQKVEPVKENASAEELQKWIASSITKYGSYKTRASLVAISNVRFDGCTLKYEVTRKSGTVSTAVMGATRTVNTVKEDVDVDSRLMSKDNVAIVDNVYPELRTIEISVRNAQTTGIGDNRIIELVVKQEAADAIRSALIQSHRLCSIKN